MMRTYRFGCRPPTVNTALAMEQLWRAHRYRNKLVEIERKRRVLQLLVEIPAQGG